MPKYQILVRFDDICPTMNFDEFKRATDLLDQYGVKPLIGVIPDCQDHDLDIQPARSDFWQFVKELQRKGYTVAMHGCNHVFDSPHHGLVNKRMSSEFAGLPLDVQVDKIKRGKEILQRHGVQTDIFFAPAHSYDENTLRALAMCGFKYMSDGKSFKPYQRCGIICLPCRSSGVPSFRGFGIHTAVFHAHEWAKDGKRDGYDHFKKLCKNHRSDIITFDEYIAKPLGNTRIQQLDEQLFMIWQLSIRPVISRIVQAIRHRRV
jgi:predicted deacetylase